MGICISSASFEIHVVDFGNENVVHYKDNNIIGCQQAIGSVFSQQGNKGLNQDSAILYQVCHLSQHVCLIFHNMGYLKMETFLLIAGIWC